MAASMWRMNGLCVAGVLALCALLLTNEVMCQDNATDVPAPSDAVETSEASTAAPSSTVFSANSAAPGLGSNLNFNSTDTAPGKVISLVKLVVECVNKENIPESNAEKLLVKTKDCVETKNILEALPPEWCKKTVCKINIFQDNNTLLIHSNDASSITLVDYYKDKLNVAGKSSGSSVFVGLLVTGLLAALALTVGYFQCQHRPSPKAVKLAEEGILVDQQNQGNTLASDTPLNPPPENQEKPSVNGESPEADKTQPPPTNGHSTANTADTEL